MHGDSKPGAIHMQHCTYIDGMGASAVAAASSTVKARLRKGSVSTILYTSYLSDVRRDSEGSQVSCGWLKDFECCSRCYEGERHIPVYMDREVCPAEVPLEV
jgi:hypothetical protein